MITKTPANLLYDIQQLDPELARELSERFGITPCAVPKPEKHTAEPVEIPAFMPYDSSCFGLSLEHVLERFKGVGMEFIGTQPPTSAVLYLRACYDPLNEKTLMPADDYGISVHNHKLSIGINCTRHKLEFWWIAGEDQGLAYARHVEHYSPAIAKRAESMWQPEPEPIKITNEFGRNARVKYHESDGFFMDIKEVHPVKNHKVRPAGKRRPSKTIAKPCLVTAPHVPYVGSFKEVKRGAHKVTSIHSICENPNHYVKQKVKDMVVIAESPAEQIVVCGHCDQKYLIEKVFTD